MRIRLIVAGGTFDKKYNEITGELFFSKTHIPEMLRMGRSTLDVRIEKLMMVDSRTMTDGDRQRILDRCLRVEEDMLVITHGTDTMVETAHHLGRAVHEKTVVLTGAIIPHAFGRSDAHFNLGSALAFVQVLPRGVYVVMNGRWFHWNDVRKDMEKGIFHTADNDVGVRIQSLLGSALEPSAPGG